jgi:hypothetical protein
MTAREAMNLHRVAQDESAAGLDRLKAVCRLKDAQMLHWQDVLQQAMSERGGEGHPLGNIFDADPSRWQ